MSRNPSIRSWSRPPSKTAADSLRANIAPRVDSVDPRLYAILEDAANALVPLGESDIVFTDDRAPVERLVDSIVLDFLLAGRADEFRLADD